MDAGRREIDGGWVAISDGRVTDLGGALDAPPAARRTIDAEGCLVTPGLINTHHHLFQNFTRAWPEMTSQTLFPWMSACFPVWERLDEEAAYLSAWVGLAEMALSGCTASTDMLYFHVQDRGDLVAATIRAAGEVGMRFHPSRASISTCGSTGGDLLPRSIVLDPDHILAECERLVKTFHQTGPGAMVQVAFGPSMTFMVGADTTRQMVELAERLDVRMHTHVAESAGDDEFCLQEFGHTDFEHFEHVGLCTDRTWVAHCVRPKPHEIDRLVAAGVAVAHCPSSNCMLGSGIAPVADLRAAGVPVGLGVDGSSSNDSGSLWLESRQALLLGKLRDGPASVDARSVLEMATRGGAACLGRAGELGELSIGSAADLAIWDLRGVTWASGGFEDPIEAWLRCGPAGARDTIVAGIVIVAGGELANTALDSVTTQHRKVGTHMFEQSGRARR